MKIHKSCKIELAVSDDPTRPALHQPYLRGSNLLATDGRLMVVLPVERAPEDVDGYVSAEALKMGRKTKSDHAEIVCNGALTVQSGMGQVTLPRAKSGSETGHLGNYPQTNQITDPVLKNNSDTVIRLSAKYLWEAAQAMGCDTVEIKLERCAGCDDLGQVKYRKGSPILIRPYNPTTAGRTSYKTAPLGSPDGYAILMPIASKEEQDAERLAAKGGAQ